MANRRKGWWVAINLLIGAPGGFVFVFTAIGLQGFMGPPTRKGQLAAAVMAVMYTMIWLLANAFLLRDVTGKRRILFYGGGLLIAALSAFLVTFAVVQLRLFS
ncbi:hypothetical protein [Gorillibacterium sp. sgz500922]|uniref:hypothetical protein n=1 Tax=Gorillibacterium sp. sgz500922 TaxID=3446694 RepID=UPI003F674CDF